MRELKEIELGEAYKVFDDDKEFYLKSEAGNMITIVATQKQKDGTYEVFHQDLFSTPE